MQNDVTPPCGGARPAHCGPLPSEPARGLTRQAACSLTTIHCPHRKEPANSSFPPQVAPVCRERLTDPYATVRLSTPSTSDDGASTRRQRERAWLRLRYNANVNDPAAYQLPTRGQAMLAAL
ncbi:hypothetical protein GCM10022221_16210 [Actinocorallia aurea]